MHFWLVDEIDPLFITFFYLFISTLNMFWLCSKINSSVVQSIGDYFKRPIMSGLY